MKNLDPTYDTDILTTRPLKKCLISNILRGDFCYKFIYFDQNSFVGIKLKSFLLNSLDNIEFILLALNINLVILSINPNSKFIKEFSYYKYYKILKVSTNLKSKSSVKGFFVQRNGSHSAIILELTGNLFECSNNVIISSSLLCDDINDCGNNDMSDEKGCHCNDATESNFRKCKIIANRKHACTFLFSLSSGCAFYHLKKSKIKNKDILSKETLNCFDNQMLSSQLINDLVVDCEYDEPLLNNIYRNLKMYSCPSPNYIPCQKGHSQCFTIANTCVYRLNNLNHLIPCRTGEHIQQCTQFNCNLMFKCPGYYCTPLSYACDGKWDCLHGYNELFSVCGTSRLYKHIYTCRNSEICIHIEDTCNGFLDCPENDDEQLCELVATKCQMKCLCHILIVQCVNVTLIGGHITQILPHILVKLSHTGLFSLWFVGYFSHVSYLYFSHIFINNLCDSFSYNNNIKFIDGSYNIISKLHKHYIYTTLLLETLYLDNNLIDRIHNKALVNFFLSN